MKQSQPYSSAFRKTAVSLAFAFLATTALITAAEAPSSVDRTWQLKLSDQRCGSFSESTVTAAAGNVTTKERMAMEINRLGSKVSITNETETVENREGEMQSLLATMSSSEAATKLRVTRSDRVLKVETEAGGKSYQKEIPVTGMLLGPKGIAKLSREKLKREGAAISYRIFAPEFGNIATIERKVIGIVNDKGRRLFKCEETIEGFPGKQSITVDEKGRWVRRQQTFPFGELVIEPTTTATIPQPQASATLLPSATPLDSAAPLPSATPLAVGTLPEEAYDRTMARSNIALPDPREITAVTLRLKHLKPDLGWPELAGPSQRVLKKSETTLVVQVRRLDRKRNQFDEKPDENYLRPNALIQSDDAEVLRIAKEVTANVEGDFEKGRRLQNWVSQNLHFDLGVALASASEVARNRRGTCIAYAVLLAALERAAGLPSRVAMGFAYADGIWGGHAWSEAYIDHRWVALDAALFSPGPADAARLGFGASSGEDQLIKLIAAAAQLYGNVDCHVTAFEYNGRSVKVPETAPRYEIKGQRYSNPWLGFSIEAPQGFRFTKTDAVFPDSTIVALEGPQASKITVSMSTVGVDFDASMKEAFSSLGNPEVSRHTLGLLTGEMGVTPKASRLIWRQGNSLWVLTAEGDSSDKLLEQIAATWRSIS